MCPRRLETLAEDGYNLIFNLEYDFDALIKGVGGAQPIAAQYPDTWFVVFNANPNVNDAGEVIHKNVISVLFDVHEGSYLAGYLSVLVNENAATLFGDGYKFTAPDHRACAWASSAARIPVASKCSATGSSKAHQQGRRGAGRDV